jgi:hypothetical protein
MSRSNRTIPDDTFFPELPEELAPTFTPLEIPETEFKGKFRRSGHLTDQMLKYNFPEGKAAQPSLFELLEPTTQEKIIAQKTERETIVEGIKLTPSEQKVIDCLSKILHEKSQNKDPEKKDYYTGNLGAELIPYGASKAKQITNKGNLKETAHDNEREAPKLAFTLYELTKEYKGGAYVAGKDIENVRSILRELESKKFLLSYIEKLYKQDGGRIERKIEDFQSLIKILKISETEYSRANMEISKKEETVILLNPIFRHQIDSKYILYPTEINRRTIIAYGSHNLSETALRLRDYLIREFSRNRFEPEIGLERLYYLLNEKWMKEGRKKKVKEFTEKAMDTVKALGLLLSYKISTGATGEPKVKFKLNPHWE